ncbi:MAG TPA: (d)CMP kinase [Solirubrobacteraceae bacterium]|jgi:cytidylate kinase|nr:(d)CMP kinase [Solirubrobacteraceae bacterium]
MVIAIDGPAGAGKSTVARAVARALGFTYLDTGAMYRCVGFLALAHPNQPPAELALGARIELGERVLLDGRDVTEEIRASAVSEQASHVACDQAVRDVLVAAQRRLVAAGDWVAEGRDIAAAVAPDAELKVFLTADPDERARRRAAESGGDRSEIGQRQVAEELRARDERDSTHGRSTLRPAPGAVTIDTTGLTVAQVVERVVGILGRDSGASMQ